MLLLVCTYMVGVVTKGMKREEALRRGKGKEKGNIMKGREALRRG